MGHKIFYMIEYKNSKEKEHKLTEMDLTLND